MSKQGNVIIISANRDAEHPSWILTTNRWGGHCTAGVVQNCLRGNVSHDGTEYGEEAFLALLCHDPGISHPIKGLGNTDTPTVEVDFIDNNVLWISGAPEDRLLLGIWSFADYRELDLNSIPCYYDSFLD